MKQAIIMTVFALLGAAIVGGFFFWGASMLVDRLGTNADTDVAAKEDGMEPPPDAPSHTASEPAFESPQDDELIDEIAPPMVEDSAVQSDDVLSLSDDTPPSDASVTDDHAPPQEAAPSMALAPSQPTASDKTKRAERQKTSASKAAAAPQAEKPAKTHNTPSSTPAASPTSARTSFKVSQVMTFGGPGAYANQMRGTFDRLSSVVSRCAQGDSANATAGARLNVTWDLTTKGKIDRAQAWSHNYGDSTTRCVQQEAAKVSFEPTGANLRITVVYAQAN